MSASATLNLSRYASSLLDAWEQKSPQRLASELHEISRITSGNAGDCERIELLEGIACEMAQMLGDLGRCEEVDVYRGLLRHLSGGARSEASN